MQCELDILPGPGCALMPAPLTYRRAPPPACSWGPGLCTSAGGPGARTAAGPSGGRTAPPAAGGPQRRGPLAGETEGGGHSYQNIELSMLSI